MSNATTPNAHFHYLPSGLRLVRHMDCDGYTFAGSPTGEHKLFGHNTERMLAHWRGYVQAAREADEAIGASFKTSAVVCENCGWRGRRKYYITGRRCPRCLKTHAVVEADGLSND